jgi:glycosyltransferase involved in cell wall biosynthesis
VIINTVDRAEPLRALLRNLEHQSYPHFEVIVVVGPTHDNTLAILKEYEDRVRVLRCPKANLSQSRNIGLLRPSELSLIDDDAVPVTWLEQRCAYLTIRLARARRVNVHPSTPVIQRRLGGVSSLAEQIDVRESGCNTLLPSGRLRSGGPADGCERLFGGRRCSEIGG